MFNFIKKRIKFAFNNLRKCWNSICDCFKNTKGKPDEKKSLLKPTNVVINRSKSKLLCEKDGKYIPYSLAKKVFAMPLSMASALPPMLTMPNFVMTTVVEMLYWEGRPGWEKVWRIMTDNNW
ncbi:MAG: hypothetical protein PVG30_09435, partial [Gammaproteobacteria bacterium]